MRKTFWISCFEFGVWLMFGIRQTVAASSMNLAPVSAQDGRQVEHRERPGPRVEHPGAADQDPRRATRRRGPKQTMR
jgi:hypothetical protein